MAVINDPLGNGDNPNLVGTNDNDQIFGLGGNDVINPLGRFLDDGTFEQDEVNGGPGTDTLKIDASLETVPVVGGPSVGLGSDYFLSTPANNNYSVLAFSIERVDITGGSANDSLAGRALDDILRGGAGDDTLTEGLPGGNDVFDGGSNTLTGDTVSYASATQGIVVNLNAGQATGASIGTDTLIGIENFTGGSGDDDMFGGNFEKTLRGGGGDDELFGGSDDDRLFGEANDDILLGGAGSDQLQGGDGNDIIVGGPNFDLIDGDAGIDTVDYSAEPALNTVNITVNLSNGQVSFEGFPLEGETVVDIEIVFTGGGDDELIGNAAGNGLDGGAGFDILKGNGGGDILLGGDDHDELYGHAGDDDLEGGSGADLLDGGANRDVLLGGDDGDVLFGRSEGDTLNGGNDNDDLIGGSSPDRLIGGPGNDDFVYSAVSESKRGSFRDTILDFKRGQDDIDLRAIDATTSAAGHSFKWIGKKEFSDKKGELRYEDKGAYVFVQGDTNGDGTADLEIRVNVGSLAGSDFLL